MFINGVFVGNGKSIGCLHTSLSCYCPAKHRVAVLRSGTVLGPHV